MAIYSPKSITVNLRPGLNSYVRRTSKKMNISMNELINQAVQYYKTRAGAYEMKTKKPMPEYWYNGKAIKNDKALIEALAKDGKLEVKKNITLYVLHEDVCEACECAFTWDFNAAVDMTKCAVDVLDKDEDLCGIKTIDYEDFVSVTINCRKYTWSGGLRKLTKLGVITVLPHQTIYCAENADYFYRDPEEPLKFLLDANEFQYFDEHLESLDEEEYEKACEIYDI